MNDEVKAIMKSIRPLHDRVLVERDKSEKKTASGLLHIPDSAQEKMLTGTVLATGPGRHLASGHFVEISVKRGDRVLFARYAGQEDRSDSDRIMLRDEEILGVFEP